MPLRDELAARMHASTQNPFEAAAKFLRIFFSDADGLDEARAHLARMAGINQRSLTQGLAGIESLLAAPPPDGRLSYLVAVEANWPLEDPSDEGAKLWLREIAQLIRDVLGSSQIPSSLTTPEGS